MSPQIIELLIFAAIAFFIINKLISILGTEDEGNPQHKNSKFGEPGSLKDVTASGNDWSIGTKLSQMKKNPAKETVIDTSLLADPKDLNLLQSIIQVSQRIEKFNITSFVKNSAKAWQMIIKAVIDKNMEMIKALVDKRYIEEISEKAEFYHATNTSKLPEAKISEVTFFGNSIMIKVLFTSENMPTEEWTYTRNLNQTGPNWFLSNVDQYIS